MEIKIVIIGAGAAGIASAKMYRSLGAQHIVLVDSKGVVRKGRTDLNPYKAEFAVDTKDETLADVLAGADMMLGLSGPRIVSQEMVKTMAENAIIFACANPTPEITPDEVKEVVKRTIVDLAPGGGYIIASANSIHSHVKPENYRAMLESVLKYGWYSHLGTV